MKKLKCFLTVMAMLLTVSAYAEVFQVNGIKYDTSLEHTQDAPATGVGCRVVADETLYQSLTEVTIPDEVTYNGTTYKVVELGSNLSFSNYSPKVRRITVGANVKRITSLFGGSNLVIVRFMGSEAPSINTGLTGSLSAVTAIVPSENESAYTTAFSSYGFKAIGTDLSLHAKSLSFDNTGATKTMLVGKTFDVTTSITKFEADDTTPIGISWTSSNTDVVEVDANGKLTAKATGEAMIFAQTNDAGWAFSSVYVTVKQSPSISLQETLSLKLNEARTLTATTDSEETIAWSSSNTSIAHVDQNGVVSAVAAGTATITATAGEASAECSVTVSSEAVARDGVICVDGIYYTVSGTNATVTYATTSYNSYSGEVVVPANFSYKGTNYEVTVVGSYAFYNSNSLTSVQIPNTVVRMEKPFGNCNNLTKVHIPFVGWYKDATKYDSNTTTLSSMGFPFDVVKELTIDGGTLFNNTFYFTSSYAGEYDKINLGEDVTVKNSAFSRAKRIGELNVSSRTTFDRGSAYSFDFGSAGSPKLNVYFTTQDEFNDFIVNTSDNNNSWRKVLGSGYFPRDYYINGQLLTVFDIPAFGSTVAPAVFYCCQGLETVTVPKDGFYFYGCPSLKTVNIPDGTTALQTFQRCTSLVALDIPSSVQSIGSFQGCTSLTSIKIPNAVTTIGDKYFMDCI